MGASSTPVAASGRLPGTDRQNNFDALRLALATLVLFSHSFVLAGDVDPIARATRMQLDGGAIAVDGFFVISGYLITQSWLNSRSTDQFLEKRVRRIYPGYLGALIVSMAIAALCSETIRYIKFLAFDSEPFVQAVFFLKYGVLDNNAAFPNNPYPHAVNGSLWTLQPELFCYLLVAAAGVLGALKRRSTIVAASGAVFVIYGVEIGTRLGANPTDFTRLFVYFAAGSLLFLYRVRFDDTRFILTAIAALLVAFVSPPPSLSLVLPIAGSYLLLSLAFTRKIRLYDVAARGDVSYGVYLYAFVVQQTVIRLFGLAHRPLVVFATALPVTFALAFASWHLVEKRFLRRAKRITPDSRVVLAGSATALSPEGVSP
jgi:peptidoglycan/LPS O-acetylase OafA/YrhL